MSALVPLPPSQAAHFAPQFPGSMSIFSRGVPPDVSTVTASPKVTLTRIVSPSP